MEQIKYYDIEKQRSHKAGFKEVLGSSKLFIGLVLIALIGCNFYLSSIEIKAWYEVHTKVFFGIFSFFVGFHLLIMLSIKSSKNDKENKNVALTNQEDKDTYFIKIGQEVKEHKGDIKESSNKENIVDVTGLPFLIEPSVLDELVAQEDKVAIETEIKNLLEILTDRQKEAVYLRFIQELEYEEVANLLDMTAPAVRKLISRAIKRMRDENC